MLKPEDPGIAMAEERPLVTLFLTAYNQEDTVRAAVEGVLAQTYSPLEIILSDDCSVDRTYEIIVEMAEEYDGPHTVCLNRNDENLGIVGHVNRMFELGTGELFVAAAGDDVSFPNRVELVVRTWIGYNRTPDGLCSGYIAVKADGESQIPPPDGFEISRHCRVGTSGLLGATAAWSRRLIERWGPLPEEGLVEDRILTLRALLCGGIVCVDKPLVWSRREGLFDIERHSWRSWEIWRLERTRKFLTVYLADIRDWGESVPSDRGRCSRLEGIVQESCHRADRDIHLLRGGRISTCLYVASNALGKSASNGGWRSRYRRAKTLFREDFTGPLRRVLLDVGDHRGTRLRPAETAGPGFPRETSVVPAKGEARTAAAFRAAGSGYATKFLRVLLGFVVTPIVLAHIGRESYGFWAIVGGVIGYVGMVDFGITGAVGTLIAREQRSTTEVNRIASNALVVFSLAGVLALVFSYGASVLAPIVLRVYGQDKTMVSGLILLAGTGLAISFPVRSLAAVLRGTQHIATLRLVEFGLALFRTVVLLGLLYAGLGVKALPWAAIVSSCVGIPVLVAISKTIVPGFRLQLSDVSSKMLTSIFNVGGWWFLGSLGAIFIYQTDNIIVGRFLGPAAVAVYALTFRVPTLVREQLYQLNFAVAPGIGDLVGRGKDQRLRELFPLAMRIVFFLGFSSGLLIVKLNRGFVSLWVGSENYGGDVLTLIMAASVLYHVVFHISSVILTNKLDLKVVAGTRFAEGVLNLLLSLVLVGRYGLEGVAAGTLIAGLSTSAWYLPYRANRILGIEASSWGEGIVGRLLMFVVGGLVGFFLVPDYESISWVGLVWRGALLASWLLVLGWLFVLPRDGIRRLFESLGMGVKTG